MASCRFKGAEGIEGREMTFLQGSGGR